MYLQFAEEFFRLLKMSVRMVQDRQNSLRFQATYESSERYRTPVRPSFPAAEQPDANPGQQMKNVRLDYEFPRGGSALRSVTPRNSSL